MENTQVQTIDSYITDFPHDVQLKLHAMRNIIKEAAPIAQEKISWRMPTFTLNGNLVHFAAFKKHIGFYPGASGIEAFKSEISEYKNSKGAVQFPLDKPLPADLITRIVQYRLEENLKKSKKLMPE